MIQTDVPDDLAFRGIFPAQAAQGFALSLDRAQPWGGGAIEGRVERREERRSRSPIVVSVRCQASWLDIAPQLVGKKRLLGLSTPYDLRTRAVPIWIDEELFLERFELGPLTEENWLRFSFFLPSELPRAVEGTFVSFRWRVEARRRRAIGWSEASLPLLVDEKRTIPTVRVETSPLGSWRLLEWRSEEERDGEGVGCSIRYEGRRPEDTPLPGETREAELARLSGRGPAAP